MALKSRGFTLDDNKLSLQLSGETENLDLSDKHPTARQRLDGWLQSLRVQVAVVVSVCVDLLLITALLLIELNVIHDPGHMTQPSDATDGLQTPLVTDSGMEAGRDRVAMAEHVLHIMQLLLLSIYMLEVLLRLVALGVELIYDRWQVFDCLVSLMTFALYVSLSVAVTVRVVTYGMGYLIILRLWRLHRIHRNMMQPVIDKARTVIREHQKSLRESQENLQESRVKIERQQKEIASLRDHVHRLQRAGHQSPGYLAHSQEHSMEDFDQCTSEEEFDRAPQHVEASACIEVSPPHTLPSPLPSLHHLYCTPQPSPGDTPITPPPPYIPPPHGYYGDNIVLVCNNLGDTADGMGSEVSSAGRIPDVVEHTQGADLCRDPSFLGGQCTDTPPSKETLASEHTETHSECPTVRDISASGNDSSHISHCVSGDGSCVEHPPGSSLGSVSPSPPMSLPPPIPLYPPSNLSPGVSLPPPLSSQPQEFQEVIVSEPMDSPTTQQDTLNTPPRSPAHLTPVLPPSECVSNSLVGSTNSDFVVISDLTVSESSDYHPSADTEAVGMQEEVSLPKGIIISDILKKKLLRGSRGSVDGGHNNAAFNADGEGLTEEEQKEIKRISAVPFDPGSVGHLLREGIPLTDL